MRADRIARLHFAKAGHSTYPQIARLEPQIPNTAAVAGKIVDGLEPVKMVDLKVRDSLERRKPNIHCYTSATVLFKVQSTPAKHACALGKEVNFESRIRLLSARKDGARPGDADARVFVIVSPERAVPATERAVACCYRPGVAV